MPLSAYSISPFFFTDTATTEIYTLSLHDALPIFPCFISARCSIAGKRHPCSWAAGSRRLCRDFSACLARSEEHTSELQSHSDLVCRLLLEKKKKNEFLVHA